MTDQAVPKLTTLHQSQVQEDEIDELGHLSVPFYEARALAASHKLLKQCGLDVAGLAAEGLELTVADAFSRNLKEQFLGASLVVEGGVLTVSDRQVQLYQQIINPDQDATAAVYAQTFVLQATADRSTRTFPAPLQAALEQRTTSWPEAGRPRSLDLDKPPFPLTLAEARQRELAARPPRTIETDECNEAGFLDSSRFQGLPYSGPPPEDPSQQWVFETADGIRVGLADLETRNTLLALPRAGDRVQVFSAEVGIARKTLRRSYWVFNLETEALLSVGSVVMACLDLDARRALEITGSLREMFERRFNADLA